MSVGDVEPSGVDWFADLLETPVTQHLLATRRALLNPRRATPFLSDFQSRAYFDNVIPGDQL